MYRLNLHVEVGPTDALTDLLDKIDKEIGEEEWLEAVLAINHMRRTVQWLSVELSERDNYKRTASSYVKEAEAWAARVEGLDDEQR